MNCWHKIFVHVVSGIFGYENRVIQLVVASNHLCAVKIWTSEKTLISFFAIDFSKSHTAGQNVSWGNQEKVVSKKGFQMCDILMFIALFVIFTVSGFRRKKTFERRFQTVFVGEKTVDGIFVTGSEAGHLWEPWVVRTSSVAFWSCFRVLWNSRLGQKETKSIKFLTFLSAKTKPLGETLHVEL